MGILFQRSEMCARQRRHQWRAEKEKKKSKGNRDKEKEKEKWKKMIEKKTRHIRRKDKTDK